MAEDMADTANMVDMVANMVDTVLMEALEALEGMFNKQMSLMGHQGSSPTKHRVQTMDTGSKNTK